MDHVRLMEEQLVLGSQVYPYTTDQSQNSECIIVNQIDGSSSGEGSKPVKRRRKRSKKSTENTEGDVVEMSVNLRKRKLTDEQVYMLEYSFGNEQKLESGRKEKIARELGLDPRQVAVWFQNRRARWKIKKLEEEYAKLKSHYDIVVLGQCQLESQEKVVVVDIPPPPNDDNIPPRDEDNENQPARASETKAKWDLFLLIFFFILEIPSCVLEPLSSTDRPLYALAAMSLSVLACLVGLIDFFFKAITEKVVWKSTWAPIPWFYYPTEISIMFGSFPEIVGLLCGLCQTILTAINCSFIISKVDAPIKFSLWPLIFAFCTFFSLYVKYCN